MKSVGIQRLPECLEALGQRMSKRDMEHIDMVRESQQCYFAILSLLLLQNKVFIFVLVSKRFYTFPEFQVSIATSPKHH
jgi:hypothetical protein